MTISLPDGVRLIQRNWLSSNQIVLSDAVGASVIDSGYVSQAEQTLTLLQHSLAGKPLLNIINTHLHSDHCGGNAILQQHYAACRTWIPAGFADAVAHWDQQLLSFAATGQSCPRFGFDRLIHAGEELQLAGLAWQCLAAPGHDDDALMFFNELHGILISGDALWENGFGVIFPELDGAEGFAQQAEVLALIASLPVRVVLPGHGAPFTGVAAAVKRAQSRLHYFSQHPERHLTYAVKALLMFILLEVGSLSRAAMLERLQHSAAIQACARQLNCDNAQLLLDMANELVQAGQLNVNADHHYFL